MITRQAVENQADRCFMYHIGAYALTVAGLFTARSRSTPWIAALWGVVVAVHGALLYEIPPAREKILLWTAEGMEDRQHVQRLEPSETSETVRKS